MRYDLDDMLHSLYFPYQDQVDIDRVRQYLNTTPTLNLIYDMVKINPEDRLTLDQVSRRLESNEILHESFQKTIDGCRPKFSFHLAASNTSHLLYDTELTNSTGKLVSGGTYKHPCRPGFRATTEYCI